MGRDYAGKIQAAIVAILIEERKRQAISHEKLAAKARISRTAISYMESGRSLPSLRISLKIAAALGMDFPTLARRAEKRVK